MKQRICLVLLCLALCAALLPSASLAAGDEIRLSLSDVTAAPGESVTVDVELSDNPGLMVISLQVSYDHSLLSLTGAAGVGLKGWDLKDDRALWLGDGDSGYNGTILQLNFRVAETAAAGKTAVSLVCAPGDIGNHEEQTFTPVITAGSVTITGNQSGESAGEAEEPEPSGSGGSGGSAGGSSHSSGASGSAPAGAPSIPFTDVPTGAYYYSAVAWAYENGITTGRSSDTFDPAGTCSRAEAVTFLWRAAGRPEPASLQNPFEDVSSEDYFYKPVLWAVEKGIIFGTDATHFSPRMTCSTAHIITIIYRALGIGTDGWYREAGDWANFSGLLKDTDLLVDPDENCPRGAMVTFLYRWSQRS